jgi:uncharacterized protein YbjT (DUF2867 family)
MYLVTGATGNVGSQVVEELLAQGKQVRVFTRDRNKVSQWSDRVQVAIGDLTDPQTFTQAAAGVEGIFLMNGVLDGKIFRQLLQGAKGHGVCRIVFLSSVLAALPDLQIGQLHKDKEDAIREAGFEASFIRTTGFMSNAGQWLSSIRAEGVVYNAMGSGKSAPIAPEDIAAVAAKALIAPRPLDQVIDVTGGELLTVPEQVNILSKAIGKPLRSIDVPIEAAVQGLVGNGLPLPVATAVAASFAAIRDGRVSQINGNVEQVTGRQPMTFAAWAQKHAARFV